MPEENQQPAFSRPSARPTLSAAPVQRGNYGIPPRQNTLQPMPSRPTPRMMDVAAPPRPFVPTAAPQPQPTQDTAPSQPAPQPIITTPREPVFNATRSRAETKSQLPSKFKRLAGKSSLPLLIIGALLLVGGAVRMVTAGNISGYTVAVAAVTANDGHKTSVQFTADDGLLHHFTFKGSDRTQIPGAALQVAYQPGAADATVKRVAVVNKAHNLGFTLMAAGVVLLLAGGVITLVKRSHRRGQNAPSPALAVR